MIYPVIALRIILAWNMHLTKEMNVNKATMIIYAIAVLILASLPNISHAQREGGQGSGGGGVYERNGQIQTLPEAGVILERAQNLIPRTTVKYYKISDSVKEQLAEIIKDLDAPWLGGELFLKAVIGKRDKFVSLDNLDQKELQSISAEYSRVLAINGYVLDESAFQLPAVSRDGKTYILPPFERLSDFQKSLILIHEYFMRYFAANNGESIIYPKTRWDNKELLARTLAIDSQIYKILNAKRKNENFEHLPLSMAFADIGFFHSVDVSNALALDIIRDLSRSLKRPLKASDFVVDFENPVNRAHRVDTAILREITNNKKILYLLEDARFYIIPWFPEHASKINRFCEEKNSSPGDAFIIQDIPYDTLLATDCKSSAFLVDFSGVKFK